MHLTGRSKLKVWVIVTMVACLFALLVLGWRSRAKSPPSLAYAPQEPEQGECVWDKEAWINGEYAGGPEDGPFAVAYSDTVTIVDDLWCDFEDDWSHWEEWEPAALELWGDTVSVSDGWWDWDGEAG